MSLTQRLERSFKPRFAVIYPFGLYFVIAGTTSEESLRHGIGFIIAGMLIRLWSNGYAIKNDKLTTSGPYAFVRNPLYLGTFLMALGFTIVLNVGWIIGTLFIASLSYAYYYTITTEQNMLTTRYGDTYRQYMAKVPAMVPCVNAYPHGEKWPFSLQRLIDSKEHKPVFWSIILLILFHLKTRLFIEHHAPTPKTWGLIVLAAGLILLDIVYEANKKK